MLNVQSTERPKRVARDLKAALAAAGHPLPYSRCLELASRMLGHPSYGMLSRSAGHAPTGPDDAASTAREVAARRALHASLLLQEGVPAPLHDAILASARPTGRSRVASGSPAPDAYGCAWFDRGSPSGWACVAGGEPEPFRSASELDPAVTWWTTLSYEEHRRLGGPKGNLLHDRHLPLAPLSALREHGLDLAGADAARAAASLASEVLARSRPLGSLVGGEDRPRSLIADLGAGWRRDPGCGEAPASHPSVWEEFIATPIRMHRGSPYETFREPRLAYARAMTDCPVPVGPCEHVSLSGDPVGAAGLRDLDALGAVAFVRARPGASLGAPCPVRGPLWHFGDRPGWLPKPVFDVLGEAMGLTPLAVMLAPTMRPAGEFMPRAAATFLSSAAEGSWADGVVAEATWRSGLGTERHGAGSWQAGLAAAYLRGVDLARMCRQALRLREEGLAVSSYGLGWVRFTRPPAQLPA